MPDTPEVTTEPATVTAAEFVTTPPPVNPAAVKLEPAAAPDGSEVGSEPAAGTPAVPPPPVERDAKGTPFDPERHIHTKHPSTGCWMPRRRPRAGSDAPTGGGGFVAPDPEPAAPPPPPSEYRIAAEGACQITYALGMMLGGDEWTPSGDDHARLLPAWEAFLKSKEVKDVPPGMALTIAMIAYCAPRMRKPKTLSTLGKLRMWWVNRKANAAARRAADAIPTPEAVP